MSAAPVIAVIFLCLACAGIVSYDITLILKPRADGTAAAVRPALERRGVPITDPASVRAKVAALVDCAGGAHPYPADTREQPALREQFRVPPYITAHEAGQAAKGWFT